MRKTMEIEDLLTLTVDSIKDFQTCARLYDYRHNDKDYEPIHKRDLLSMKFENTLKKVVSFFFYKKQAGSVPSYSALLNRWERLWFPKDADAYDLATEQHESAYGNLSSYSTEAASALLKFYEDFTDHPGTPVLIDEEFTILIKREIRLKGNIDLVLRTDGAYQIFKWSARHRKPGTGPLLVDFAALKMAFEHRNQGRYLPAEYGLYDLISAKPGFNTVEIEQADVNALVFWANAAYEEEIYPSRRGFTAYCKSCPFDAKCEKWRAWPEAE